MPTHNVLTMSSWLSQYSTNASDFTHLLLNGGKCIITQQEHTTFLNQYGNAIARKETLYIVEKKTPIFRLFVDFDFQPPPSDHIIEGALKSFVGLSATWFDVRSDAVVLRKTVDTPKKIGVHLTWDSVYVTPSIAMAFRAHVLEKLEDAHHAVDWHSVIDQAVYGGSGLRMPWSHKRGAPGVYVPVATISHDGTWSALSTPTTAAEIRTWVHRTCIRSYGHSASPTCADIEIDHFQSLSCGIRSPSTQTAVTVVADMGQYDLELLKKALPDPFSKDPTFCFTSMHKYNDNCFVFRSNSKRCGNKGYNAHTSSTVYFVLLKRGTSAVVYQKCFSRKDIAYETTCATYVGPQMHLSQAVVDVFWPPEIVQKLKSTDTLKAMLQKIARPGPKSKKRPHR